VNNNKKFSRVKQVKQNIKLFNNPMQAFGRNQISVSRFRFALDGIFDRFQVSGFGVC
jgi:hypothetical protein